MNLLEKFSEIETFIFDLDGVLTDGKLTIIPNTEYTRTMDIKDGYAMQLAIKKGYHILVISGSRSNAVAQRLAYLGITEFHQGITNKKEYLEDILLQLNLNYETSLFVGDDVPDMEAMQFVALSCCPADAAVDVLKMANYISPKLGGNGCARDIIEKVMKLRGDWDNGSGVSAL